MIGDASRMPEEARRRLERCIEETSHGTGLTLVLAISYSSRWEIVEACKQLAGKVAAGELKAEEIDDALFGNHLSTAGMPDPDLLIRTGGDMRVSNFLLWQIAYSELFVTSTYWPDFSEADFLEAIQSYGGRQRRFGLTGEQVK